MKTGKIHLLFFLLILTACSSSVTQPAEREEVQLDLEKYFQGFDGASVMHDLNANRYMRYNPDGCAERLLPASTFKIMNALVALETGIVPDEDYVIPWDGTQYEIQSWNQDHTLRSAFQNSVVWYYVDVAGRVGDEKMQQYIDAVRYGNQNIHGVSDAFWLDGSLTISANEQVEFLKRLYKNDLPFSKRSMDIVKDMMILVTEPDLHLRGKTGTAMRVDSQYVGWFVGYQELNGNVYIFATNLTSDNARCKWS